MCEEDAGTTTEATIREVGDGIGFRFSGEAVNTTVFNQTYETHARDSSATRSERNQLRNGYGHLT